MSDFKLYTALVTPFTHDNLIDFDALKQLVLRLLKQGVNGLVVLGTTAEACALTLDERIMIIRYLRNYIPTSIPMIVGVGTNNVDETMRNCRIAKELGADAVLVVTPYYVCPSQEGLFAYYDYLATYCPVPIYLYNVKRRCGVVLEVDTTDRLIRKHSNIVGLKQAGGNYKEFLLLKKKYPTFELFSGDDNRIVEALELSMDGIISVMGNACFEQLKKVVELPYKTNQWNEMCQYFYEEPTPTPTKYVLSKQGIGTDKVRLPLCTISNELKEKLDKYVK